MKKLIIGLLLVSGAAFAAAKITNSDIVNNAQIANSKLASMANNRFKGNISGSSATPSDLTGTQVTAALDNVVGDSGSGGTKGLVPAPAAGDAAANKFLKADGNWATAGVTDHGALTGLGDDDHTIYALLAGRSGGQTIFGDTASGGNLVLGSTAHATKGKIYLGASSYYQETVGSELLKVVGTTTNQNLFEMKGSAATTFAFGIISGALYLVEGSNEYFYAKGGWMTFGSGNPKYAADFNQSATSTAPLTDIVQTSGTYNLPILAVRNRSNTANTYSGIVFSGGSSSQEAGVQIVGVHESTTVGAETSHLDVNIRNAGTVTNRLRLSSAGVLTLSGYGAGTLVTDASGVVSASSSANTITVSTKTTAYTLTNSDDVILANCSSDCTMTMHAVSAATSKVYRIKNIGTATVIIYPNGSDTFDGETTIELAPGGVPKQAVELIPNGSALWSIF